MAVTRSTLNRGCPRGFTRQQFGLRGRLPLAPTISLLLVVGGGTVAWPSAAGADTSASVTITINSKQASPGTVEVTNNVGSVYGTCVGAQSHGGTTCNISVPVNSGVLLIAQPSQGEQVDKWTGPCTGTPGDVCHVQSGAGGTTTSVAVKLSHTASGAAAISLSSPEMAGSGPNNCIPSESVTASGSGFPVNTAATLSDDGYVVASGSTDSLGNVSLTDGPGAGEPGIYRVLTLDVGGVTASNDVFNSGIFCVAQFSTGGTISVRVDASGLDANSSSTSIAFPGQSPVPVVADSTGSGSGTTPYYPCTPGNQYGVVFTGTRGAGTHQAYTFSATFNVSC